MLASENARRTYLCVRLGRIFLASLIHFFDLETELKQPFDGQEGEEIYAAPFPPAGIGLFVVAYELAVFPAFQPVE